MDFSSPSRALLSLERRRPVLPDDILAVTKPMLAAYNSQLGSGSSSTAENQEQLPLLEYLRGIRALLTKPDLRWEALAVGLYCGTGLLEAQSPAAAVTTNTAVVATTNNNTGSSREGTTVYMDGPRVPSAVPGASANHSNNATTAMILPQDDIQALVTTLHETSLAHLEHTEPRIRTLVAKAVGAHAAYYKYLVTTTTTTTTTTTNADEKDVVAVLLKDQCTVLYERVTTSITEHMQTGRTHNDTSNNIISDPSSAVQPAGQTSNKTASNAPKEEVLDDTTGWRALETNWQCLACLVQPLGKLYFDMFPLMEENDDNTTAKPLLEQCRSSAMEHVNRHVRAAALLVLEQWIRAAASMDATATGEAPRPVHAALCATVTQVLKDGLADNWSQVRMAASVLCRVFFKEYLAVHPAENSGPMYAILIPRMALNRFYLAQGVKLYSHDTWRQVFSENGLDLVAQNVGPVCRYYVKMCDANNHVVREGACQAVAELAVKLSKHDPEALQPYVSMLLQALLMCFHDESWPVRDEACLACGIFCKAYPEECREELQTLWERWTEQLTDQIWSVREDAAAALGDAMQAYGKEMHERCIDLVKKLLPSAKDQPAMSMEEYKQKQNDIESHTDAQLYSCGSLAPKLGKKSGAGRIGCGNCGVTRPKAPWEATDGCVYLLRELVVLGCGEENEKHPELTMTDELLLPLLTELADVCRVQHFPQGDDLRATLWRQLPGMAHALGKQRFKRTYLTIFTDLLISNMERSTASALSKHAAGQCAEELAQLVGYSIFRGRLDDYQQETFDKAMRDRQHNAPKGPMDGGGFSPFGPPGMLDPYLMPPGGGRGSPKSTMATGL